MANITVNSVELAKGFFGLRQFNIANYIAYLKSTNNAGDLSTALALDELQQALVGIQKNIKSAKITLTVEGPKAEFIFGRGTATGLLPAGPANIVNGDLTNQVIVDTPGTLLGWAAVADTPPIGRDALIDVFLNGTSVFGSGPKITLKDGIATVQTGSTFNKVYKVNVKDTLQGEVVQTGLSAPGQSIFAAVYWA